MRWSTLAATSQVGRQIVRRLCNYRLNHQSRLWSVWTTRRQIMRWLQKSFRDTFIVRRCYHFRDVIWMSNELIFTSWPKKKRIILTGDVIPRWLQSLICLQIDRPWILVSTSCCSTWCISDVNSDTVPCNSFMDMKFGGADRKTRRVENVHTTNTVMVLYLVLVCVYIRLLPKCTIMYPK